MGFLTKWFIRIVALASFIGIAMWSWNVWKHNDLELGALAFGAAMVARSTLLAWLGRHGDVGALFRSEATSFIKTPLEQYAFLVPIYAAPAVWSQYGLFYTLVSVPIAWIVVRLVVKGILQRTSGGTYEG